MKNSPATLKKRNELKKKWKRDTDPNSFPHEVLKKCCDCNNLRPCKWMSSFTQTGEPEYRARCHSCHLKKAQGWRKGGQKKISQQAKKRRLERKKKCIDYLGGECRGCGFKRSTRALTFHHHNDDKDKDISQMIDWSWDKVKAELDRCTLLCFNCHMEAHSNEDLQ